MKNYRNTHSWFSVLLFMVLCCSGNLAFSAPLKGIVTDENGAPLGGVMITLINNAAKRSTTIVTDAHGRYHFEKKEGSDTSLRARLIGYADKFIELDPFQYTYTTSLVRATDEELMQQLPAHVWAERVALKDDGFRRQFRIQCMMCHQQGYPNARWPKTKDQWFSVFDRMAHKRALLTGEARDELAEELIKAYDVEGPLGMPRIPEAPRGKARQVEITEWRLSDVQASMHDVAPGPDGKIYGVDTEGNNIWRLDPDTDIIEELTHLYPPHQEKDASLLLHTVIQAPDGKMWFTYAKGNLIASLDVFTDEIIFYDMSYLDGIYPHTMRFDKDGQIWFSVTITNQLGTIDPGSGEIVLYDLPTRNISQSIVAWPPVTLALLWVQEKFDFVTTFYDELIPIAYGIDVTPDGKIWIGQFNSRRIIGFDKKTKEFDIVDTPFGGPRRFRADSKGVLWIPAFTDGLIYSYNPATITFTPYEMPTGRGDSTYALAVDANDNVWACGSNSDTMMHLNTNTKEIVTYQLPTRVTFCREIYFTEDGSTWTSYSNYPSTSIEGGSSAFVRIRLLVSKPERSGEQ